MDPSPASSRPSTPGSSRPQTPTTPGGTATGEHTRAAMGTRATHLTSCPSDLKSNAHMCVPLFASAPTRRCGRKGAAAQGEAAGLKKG